MEFAYFLVPLVFIEAHLNHRPQIPLNFKNYAYMLSLIQGIYYQIIFPFYVQYGTVIFA